MYRRYIRKKSVMGREETDREGMERGRLVGNCRGWPGSDICRYLHWVITDMSALDF